MIDNDSASEISTGRDVGVIEVFHADSLAGPMGKLKPAFEAKNKKASINLSSGTSKQLAERILKGDTCDVFASSSPAVIEDLMKETLVPPVKPLLHGTWFFRRMRWSLSWRKAM